MENHEKLFLPASSLNPGPLGYPAATIDDVKTTRLTVFWVDAALRIFKLLFTVYATASSTSSIIEVDGKACACVIKLIKVAERHGNLQHE